MQRSRHPAPSFWLTIIPSLLIVASFDVGSSSAADNKPLDFFIPPLIARNVAPTWVQSTDSLQIVGGDSANVHLQVIDPDAQDIQIATFAMPDFVSIIDSGDGRGCLIVAPPTILSGRFSMLLVAIDDSLAADTVDFTIIVSRLNRPPVWLNPDGDSIEVMEGKSTSVHLTATDADGDYLYALTLGTFSPTISSTGDGNFELLFSPDFGSAGSYELGLVASDLALADTLWLFLTVTSAPPNHPPVWTMPESDSVGLREGELGVVQVHVTDEDGDLVSVDAASDIAVAVSDIGDGYFDIFIMPDVDELGRRVVNLIASDDRDSDTLVITVQVFRNPGRNHAPAFVEPPTSIQLNVNRDTTIAVRAIDSDLDDITFSGFYLPDFVEIVGRPFPARGDAWADILISPGSAHQGVFPVYFVASDGSLTDTVAIWITITNINFWPEIGEIPARTMAEGDTLEIELVASDANGTTVTLSAFSMPTGATFVDHRNNRATFRFIPSYAQAGQYRIGFIANDGSLRDTVFLDITVLNALRPPQFAAVSPKTVNEGSTIRIPLSATDPDNDHITLYGSDFPEHAVVTDSGNGRGDITFAPVLGQIGPFELTVIASDGVLADTMTVLVTVLQVSVPPDSVADVDFITEQVAKYTTSFVVDQIHTEDLNLDGIDEVLFRESVDGGHVLRIWSVAGDSLWALPPVGMGIKSYTLRAQNGLIEPVVWTNGNELLGLAPNRGGWELLATVPDSVARIQWLPDNAAAALALGAIPYSKSGYSENPIGCTSYNSTTSSNSLLLTAHGTGQRWTGLGYAQVQPFDYGGAFPVFDQGVQRDLLVLTFSEDYGYEAWGNCGMPHSWKGAGLSLGTFAEGTSEYSFILNAIRYSCFSNEYCSSPPNQYNYFVGLSRWNGSEESGLKLCFAGRPGVDSPYQAEGPYRMTVLTRGESWTATEVGFNLGVTPARGGILTVADRTQELMLLAADAGLGYVLTIPDAQAAGRLRMPAAGRFKTGYVLDTANRDMVFKVLDGVSIYRVKPYVAPRDTALVHHVPTDFSTIQDAINAALSGDTIIVAPGSYPGSIDFLGKDICLRSSGGAASTFILPASTTRPAVRFAGGESENAILDGFTIRLSSTSTVAIENDAKPTVRNNVFREQQGSGDVMTIKSKGALITRNVFAGNTNARCILIEASGSARIVNNTLDLNKRGITAPDTATVVLNNSITNHSGFGLDGRFGIVDYNNLWQNHPDYYPGYGYTTPAGYHDIHVDPFYHFAESFDYQPLVESRCVDAGHPASEYRDPDGTRADIGALAPLTNGHPRVSDIHVVGEEQHHVRTLHPEIGWSILGAPQSAQQAVRVQIAENDTWTGSLLWDSGPIATQGVSLQYTGGGIHYGPVYYVRVAVQINGNWTTWTFSNFRTNTIPDPPLPLFPINDHIVSTTSTTLIVRTVDDVESDLVTYEMEIYSDDGLTSLLYATEGVVPGDTTARSEVIPGLETQGRYWWRARSNDGFQNSPWCAISSFRTQLSSTVRVPYDQPTIQFGVDAAADGDTVQVYPGVYTENLVIDNRTVLIQSVYGPDSTTVQPADTMLPTLTITSEEDDGVIVSGLRVISGPRTIAVRCTGGHPRISDCVVEGKLTEGSFYGGGGIAILDTKDAILERNDLKNTRYPASAIQVTDSKDALIQGNLIRGASNYNIVLSKSHGIIHGNTILHGSIGVDVGDGSTADIRNNIIAWCRNYPIDVPHSNYVGVIEDYNCIYGNGSLLGFSPTPRHNVHADPKFRDTAAADYRLHAISGCIDRGDPETLPDPDGSRSDIGAFPLGGRLGEPHIRLGVDSPSRITAGPPVFHWGGFTVEAQQEAMELQIDDDNDWSDPPQWTTNILTIEDTFLAYTGPTLDISESYFYRLRVLAGSWTGWAYSTLHVNASPTMPAPQSPVGGAVVPAAGFTFSIYTSHDADGDPLSYELEIYSDASLVDLISVDTLGGGDSTAVSSVIVHLDPEKTYWWRVNCTDGWDMSGWSDAESFRTRRPVATRVPGQYASISDAIAASYHGDTVLVAPGFYPGGFSFKGKLLYVVSEAGASSTMIDLDSSSVHEIRIATTGLSGGELRGFTIRGGTGDAAVQASGANVIIAENVFTGFHGGTSVVRAGSSGESIITHNLFVENGGTECIGLHYEPARIVNNTFYNNRAGFFTHWPGAVAISNIVVGCSTYAIWGQFDTANYNLLWDNLPYDGNGYQNGPNDVLADPHFVNPAAGDFRLAAGSPCIDAGHPDPQYNDPDGTRNDIGAFPFVPGVSALHPDDHNGDGTVDVRDAVRLIDLTVRKSESAKATGTSDQIRVRELIRRIWETKEARK